MKMFGTMFGSKAPALAKGVHMYFSSAGVIVAALHENSSGILFEQSDALNIEGSPGATQLGLAFREAFDRFCVADRDLAGAKKTEWPAFLVSKLSSVKRFENSYRMVSCMSLNTSNSIVRASMPHPAGNGVELSVSFNPLLPPHLVGEQLLNLIACADAA